MDRNDFEMTEKN